MTTSAFSSSSQAGEQIGGEFGARRADLRCAVRAWLPDRTFHVLFRLAAAPTKPGSWWPEWIAWLDANSTPDRVAPPVLGGPGHPPIMDAPGSYVRQR